MASKKDSGKEKVNGAIQRRISAEEFVIAWQKSDSLEDVAEVLGMTRMAVRQRAYAYRKHDIPLKSMRTGGRSVDWDSLRALAVSEAPSEEG